MGLLVMSSGLNSHVRSGDRRWTSSGGSSGRFNSEDVFIRVALLFSWWLRSSRRGRSRDRKSDLGGRLAKEFLVLAAMVNRSLRLLKWRGSVRLLVAVVLAERGQALTIGERVDCVDDKARLGASKDTSRTRRNWVRLRSSRRTVANARSSVTSGVDGLDDGDHAVSSGDSQAAQRQDALAAASHECGTDGVDGVLVGVSRLLLLRLDDRLRLRLRLLLLLGGRRIRHDDD